MATSKTARRGSMSSDAVKATQARLDGAMQVVEQLAEARTLTLPSHHDEVKGKDAQTCISHIFRDVLPASLTAYGSKRQIHEDDPCFDAARQYCKESHISPVALDNFVELACGNPRFPAIAVLDSDINMNCNVYNTMVESSQTLLWIEEALEGAGLSLTDVSVIDVAALYNNRSLRALASVDTNQGFSLFEEVLQIFEPSILLLLQAPTVEMGSTKSAINRLRMPASITDAFGITAMTIGPIEIQVIQSYCISLADEADDDEEPAATKLKISSRIMSRLYEPCAKWKYPIEALMRLDDTLAGSFGAEKFAAGADAAYPRGRQ